MKDKVKVVKDNGEETIYDVLATFKLNDKDIVLYTNYQKDDANDFICHASYIINDKLSEINDEDDLNKVHEILKTIMEEIKN